MYIQTQKGNLLCLFDYNLFCVRWSSWVHYRICLFRFFFSNLTWAFDSDQLNEIVGWMEEWGGIIVLISGFSPIPYKVFTIASGITGLAFLPFLVASFIGRGLRFFLISFIVIRGGENIEQKIRKNAEVLGWVTVLILVLYFSLTFLAK